MKHPKKLQGFASMSPEQRKQIASKGGKSVKEENRAFSRDKNLAVRAGYLSRGLIPPESKKDE